MTNLGEPSRLTPSSRVVVLDTSVVLNLLASGAAARVLETLGLAFWVPTQVVREVRRQPDPASSSERSTLRYLLDTGLVRELTPEDGALDTVLDLVAAPSPDGLDDGEAATIAIAESLGCSPALDERKARRIATARRPDQTLSSSIDLFKALEWHTELQGGELCEWVFNALRHANMRVLHPHTEWVMQLIGRERAARCPSLPA